MRAPWLLSTLLLAAACSDSTTAPSDTGPDASVAGDAIPSADATEPAPDALAGTDAELAPDAAPEDAGITPDAVFNGDFERDPNRIDLRGACPQETRLGGFAVSLNETSGYTALDGVVKNGVTPNTVRDVILDEGGCKLLRRRRLACEPPCAPGSTCNAEATCIPTPLGQDMGTVRFLGLIQPVELAAQQPGNTYFYTRLRHPGVDEGAVVQVTAPAPTYFVPLELYGIGVRQLVPLESRWVLTEGQPLVLHWEAPTTTTRAQVHVELNIDLHGLTPLLLVCDLPDTGTGTVARALIDGLVASGVTGFPEGRVARRTVDAVTQGAECVDFTVSSVRDVEVEVTGHIPCARQTDCPMPLVCDLAIQQCH